MNTITLKQQGYLIKGVSDLTPWGGGNAAIQMTSFKVSTLKEIKDGINDGGFGVENINGAVCDVYRLYKGNGEYDSDYSVFARTLFIGKISDNTHEYSIGF